MSRNPCPSCSLPILRTDSTLQCIKCAKLFHKLCCPSPWTVSPSLVNCCTSTSKQPLQGGRRAKSSVHPPAGDQHSASSPSSDSNTQPRKKRQSTPPSPSLQPSLRRRGPRATPPPTTTLEGVNSAPLSPPTQPIACSSASSSMEAQPDWFSRFLTRFEETSSDIKSLRSDVVALREENAALRTLLQDQQTRIDAQAASQVRLEARMSALESTIGAPAARPLSDTRELLVTGLPPDLSAPHDELFAVLLTAIGLPGHRNSIASTRVWSPLSKNTSDGQTTAKTPSLAFVVKCLSVGARDDILHAAPRLRNVTCQQLFKTGGNGSLLIRPLWPRPVHTLHSQAITAARRLNYARPVVNNLVVFMRQTRDSPLLPIYSASDLDSLQPYVSQ